MTPVSREALRACHVLVCIYAFAESQGIRSLLNTIGSKGVHGYSRCYMHMPYSCPDVDASR